MDWNVNRIKDLATSFNLSFSAYGKEITSPKEAYFGSLVLSSAFAAPLEPAPLTPISGELSTPYKVLSGTIKATYNAHHGVDGNDNIIVAPGMPTGNTGKGNLDTRTILKTNGFRTFRHPLLLATVVPYFQIQPQEFGRSDK